MNATELRSRPAWTRPGEGELETTDWSLDEEQPVLRIGHLQHHFGQGEVAKQVLFDNNIEILAGEMVILTGPSGSGKTTLLTLIGALRTVQEGSVQVLGTHLKGLSNHELVGVRRNIGFIFQAHNLFESLTAYQNVKLALELKLTDQQVMHERTIELLTALGLEQRIHYKPAKLSGGQRQRVAIARALANRPQLILADEPTAALDEKSGRDVVNLLQKMAKEDKVTSIIVTHDNRILDVADRLVNMVDGRIKKNTLVKESVTMCEFLSKCAAFSGLTPANLADVAEKMIKVRCYPGDVVIRQGEPGDKFYLIRRGSVNVIVDEGTPERRLLATLAEGEFFGERALITGEPRNATIVAREKLEVYTLDKPNFQAALEASASFKEQLYQIYFQRQ